jgi:acetyl esterase/lipase
MKRVLSTLVAIVAAVSLSAQEPIAIPIWPDGAPTESGLSGPEIRHDDALISNVSEAVMYVYPADPAKNTGAALVICPGGGYVRLAIDHEGHDIAKWLSANGITGIVLKYRIPNGHHEIPLDDTRQTLRLVRARAAEWGVDPHKVGISGSSAGGHLAATTETLFEDESSFPDYAVLFYPVISFDPAVGHRGSARGLIGSDLNEELLERYSAEKQVSEKTPPTILFHSADDRTVSPINSVAFYRQMQQFGVKGSLYIFPTGDHGWGFRPSFRYHEEWKTLLLKWLEDMGFTRK